MRGLIFLKNKRGEVAPFPTLSFPLLSLSSANGNTTYIYIYLFIFHLFVCRSLRWQTQSVFSFIPLSLLAYPLRCFVWLPIRFHGVYLSISLSSSTDPPHPYFTIQNRWLPHSLIFLFLNFQNFFVEKMWYDLFTFRVCLCMYEMFTY